GIFAKGGVDLKAFATKGAKGNLRRKLFRFLTHGYLMDVKVLEDCVRSNVGDITFEEAYGRTKRVLNITVSSARKNEVPRLLNYLTAPNVLIWSAACASAAVIGLYESVDLLAKDRAGNIVQWSPSTIKWGDVTLESESPEMRLAELFNVNHFILSQADPSVALNRGPQSKSGGITAKLSSLARSEMRHRMYQLGQLGVIPQYMHALFDQRTQGHVTISPPLTSKDFYTIFSNPTYDSLNYWILKGEQSTWPSLSFIRSRMKIELALDKGILIVERFHTGFMYSIPFSHSSSHSPDGPILPTHPPKFSTIPEP
ncbi:acyl transferase/acyl hydrolase/lysophospholipase, partial [Blyttiomyces helicus]